MCFGVTQVCNGFGTARHVCSLEGLEVFMGFGDGGVGGGAMGVGFAL